MCQDIYTIPELTPDLRCHRKRHGWVCGSGSWLLGIFPCPKEKKTNKKKNPSNSDAIGCSGDAIHITNRLVIHPETLPENDRPNQLLRSSEIGPIEDGGVGFIGDPQTASQRLPGRPAGRPAEKSEKNPENHRKIVLFFKTWSAECVGVPRHLFGARQRPAGHPE